MIGERCKSYHVRYSNILFGKYPQIAVEKTLRLTQKVSHVSSVPVFSLKVSFSHPCRFSFKKQPRALTLCSIPSDEYFTVEIQLLEKLEQVD